jgi:hypothetical protein
MKVTLQCNETVIPDDPRVGIGLNTVPESSGFKQEVGYNEVYLPETPA